VGAAGSDAGGGGEEASLVRGGVRAREPVPVAERVAAGVAEGAAEVRVAVVPAAVVVEEEEVEEEEGEGSLEARGRRLGSPETPPPPPAAAAAVPAILSLEEVAVGLGVAATEPPGPKIDPLVAVFEGAVGGAL
jgi:hypothetical protein